MRFYHSFAKGRKSRNLISSLLIDGSLTIDPANIEEALISFYSSLYTRILQLQLGSVHGLHSSSFLVRKGLLLDEIKRATFELPKDKAPGHDGFSIAFFQDCWDTIKDDLFPFFLEFQTNSILPWKLNATFLTLIPKKKGATTIKDF